MEKKLAKELVKVLDSKQISTITKKKNFDAQMVFCIDTRSELIRTCRIKGIIKLLDMQVLNCDGL
jgi:uncharacterized protein YbcC (UPF0753/DUF2309 family)